MLVCYTAVFSVVTQLSSSHNTNHDCGCVADSTDIALRDETKTAALTRSTHTWSVFHLSELAGRTSQLANEIDFFQKVLLKNHLLQAYYLGFD